MKRLIKTIICFTLLLFLGTISFICTGCNNLDNSELLQLQQRLQQCETTINNLNNALNQKNAEIEELNQTILEQQETIKDLQSPTLSFTYNGYRTFGSKYFIDLLTNDTKTTFYASYFRIESENKVLGGIYISTHEANSYEYSRASYNGKLVLKFDDTQINKIGTAKLYYKDMLISTIYIN